MPKSAKAFRESLKKSGVFYTPKKLAEFMRSFFPKDVPEIYGPTCGDGALLAEFPESKKFGQEIDAEQAAYARQRFHGSLRKRESIVRFENPIHFHERNFFKNYFSRSDKII